MGYCFSLKYAEYKVVTNATYELIWIETLLKELDVRQTSPHVIWCDNIGATYLSSNLGFHACTKQIKINFHFIREKVAQKLLQVWFGSSKDQLADIFNKVLPLPLFEERKCNLNMSPIVEIDGGTSMFVLGLY
jgi:hypothetical protein